MPVGDGALLLCSASTSGNVPALMKVLTETARITYKTVRPIDRNMMERPVSDSTQLRVDFSLGMGPSWVQSLVALLVFSGVRSNKG